MKIVTDASVTQSGHDTVLTLTKHTKETVGGIMVEPTGSETATLTVLAPFALGAGDPPTDGSISNQLYFDTSSQTKYLNTGSITAPTWVEI
jgi:hypothetical protein